MKINFDTLKENEELNEILVTSVIYPRQLLIKVYNDIITKAIHKHKGIIYGRFVTELIRRNHFTDLYYKKCRKFKKDKDKDQNQNQDQITLTSDKFWDPNIDEETIDRLLTSSMINIAFEDINDTKLFLQSLKNDKFHQIEENKTGSHSSVYKVTKSIRILGKRFSFAVNLNIFTNIGEPPYNNLFFNTLGLVIDSKSMRLSNSTGTYLDDLNSLEKIRELNIIIENIIEKKTLICAEQHENTLLIRMSQMIKDGYDIINIPFLKFGQYNDSCTICTSTGSTVKIIECYFCRECAATYIETKTIITEEIFDEDGFPEKKTYIECPYRQKCYLKFKYDKEEEDEDEDHYNPILL